MLPVWPRRMLPLGFVCLFILTCINLSTCLLCHLYVLTQRQNHDLNADLAHPQPFTPILSLPAPVFRVS